MGARIDPRRTISRGYPQRAWRRARSDHRRRQTHRFSTTKNARDNAGEYRFFDDRFPAGFAKDYRRGIYFTWSARDDATVLSEPERAERAKIIRDREQRRQREQAEAARIAQQRWQKAKAAAPAHPYLTRKGVQAHGARQEGDALLVAVMDGDELISVQSIGPDGRKLFQLGSISSRDLRPARRSTN